MRKSTTGSARARETLVYRGTGGKVMMLHSGTTSIILAAAIDVHRHLGPGLLESAYHRCLAHELRLRRVPVQEEVPIDLVYRGLAVRAGYRVDLVVDSRVLVEVKAVERIHPIHESQLLTYLRLSQLRVGLLLNFNVARLREGILRRVL